MQKLPGFSAWKPWKACGLRPWASQGFQAEKPGSFCTAGLLILVFPMFTMLRHFTQCPGCRIQMFMIKHNYISIYVITKMNQKINKYIFFCIRTITFGRVHIAISHCHHLHYTPFPLMWHHPLSVIRTAKEGIRPRLVLKGKEVIVSL